MLPAFFACGAAPGVSQIPRRWQAANCGIERTSSAAELKEGPCLALYVSVAARSEDLKAPAVALSLAIETSTWQSRPLGW